MEDTAEEVCARGGQGIPVRADLGNEEEAAALFRRVEEEQGRLDLMVDSAWGATIAVWRDTAATIDAAWLASVHAARSMVLNRLIADMSRELKKSKVAMVGINPGFMRTERVLRHMTTEALKKQFRFDLSESPEYIGRAAAALAADPKAHSAVRS